MGYHDEIDTGYHGETRTEEKQKRALRLGTLARVYQGADRILTGDPLVVNIVDSGPAPAWSDGASITLNAEYINEMDLETLVQINGLNYHELAHHLYTPRKGTPLVQWVIENDLFQSFNILEDQRIDTLLCARYPSIMPFLEATVLRYLADKPEEAIGNYLVVRGRKYLPVEVRQGFRDIFIRPDLIPAICRIVDEYRVLAFPRDYARAQELIKQLQDEVLVHLPIPCSGGISQCGHRSPIQKGRPEPGKMQEYDSKRAKGMGVSEDEYVPRTSQEKQQLDELLDEVDRMSTAPGNVNGNEDGEDPLGKDPLADLNNQIKTSQDALAKREASIYSAPSVGQGHVDSVGGIPEDLQITLNNALNKVHERKDVLADVKRKQSIVIGGDDKGGETGRPGKFDKADVPSAAMVAYRKFAHELQKLRDDAEPFWVKEMPSGKLNVPRLMRGEVEVGKAFDRWTEQDDSTDIEAIICVDRSGSMGSGNNDQMASIACWTIKRALEHIDCPVTVYAFDDKTEVAYSRTEKADKTQFKFIYGSGGTEPYESLILAEKTLMSSTRSNKMLFIITDGVFNTNKNDEVIARMAKRGILTSLVLIMRTKDYLDAKRSNEEAIAEGRSARWELRHGAEIFGNVNSAADLVPLARAIVTGAIRKKSRR
jgi:Mg-chelatase subunit ChlD